MERVYHLIVYKPKSVLFLILLLTGFLAYHARHIRLDSSVDSLLPKEDPEKHYYNEVRQLFGSDEIGIIGLITDNVYTAAVLQKIKRLPAAHLASTINLSVIRRDSRSCTFGQET